MPLKKMLHVYERSIIMAVVMMLSVAGIIFGVYPIAQKTRVLYDDSKKIENENSVLQQKVSVLAAVDEETLKNTLHDLSTAVPPEKSPATVLSTVDGVITSSGVTMSGMELERPGAIATDSAKKQSAQEAKAGSNILPFRVAIAGDFTSIRSFLTTLTSVRRLFRIYTFQISFGEGVDARVDTQAYYVPYPTDIGSVSKPISPISDSEQQIIDAVAKLPLAYTENLFVAVPGSGPPLGKTDPFSL